MMGLGLDIHGGPFGGGKYRKGKVVEEYTDILQKAVKGEINHSINDAGTGNTSTDIAGSYVENNVLYIFYKVGGTLSVCEVDLADMSTQVTAIAGISSNPALSACVRYGNKVYIPNRGGQMYVVDTETFTLISTISVGGISYYALDADITPNGEIVLVMYRGNSSLKDLRYYNADDGSFIKEVQATNASDYGGSAKLYVKTDADGNVYVNKEVGSSNTYYPCLVKYDAQGNVVFSRAKNSYVTQPLGLYVDKQTGRLFSRGVVGTKVFELDPATGDVIKESALALTFPTEKLGSVFDKYGNMILMARIGSGGSSYAGGITYVNTDDLTFRYETVFTGYLQSIQLAGDNEIIRAGVTTNYYPMRVDRVSLYNLYELL